MPSNRTTAPRGAPRPLRTPPAIIELLPAAVAWCMKQGSGLTKSAVQARPRPVPVPTFLLHHEPWPRVFFRNLADLWPRASPTLQLVSKPAPFWPDVFVVSRLPWLRFLESALGHVVVIAGLWGLSQVWVLRPRVIEPPPFTRADVIYYPASEYLPPLNTGSLPKAVFQRGDPEYAPQPIISVPPEADNRSQTIVTPPDIKLKHEAPLPNIVEWSHDSVPVPLAATERSAAEMKIPSLSASVVEPPPRLEASSRRRLGDINIGHPDVIAPAPQLPVAEQRAVPPMAQTTLGNSAPDVVPPPPSTQGINTGRSGGRLIALGIHPVTPAAPMEVPAGNRRGTFAATPEGKRGATGTPDITSSTDGHSASGGNGAGVADRSGAVPPGLYVGGAAGHANPGGGTTIAGASPPHTTSIPRQPAREVSEDRATELDRKVFGGRKVYSMALNMPNLNSAGGSWVIRFAELTASHDQGDLTAPVATQKVDPGYPAELMRKNVEGTVMLRAVIESDGTVDEVRILRGVDDRLDEYARAALSRWHFLPGTKNGSPVAIEAVVMIPFRAAKPRF